MWCDIFPYMESPPEPMNIDPPLPVEMELRVIVYDCINVSQSFYMVFPEFNSSDFYTNCLNHM